MRNIQFIQPGQHELTQTITGRSLEVMNSRLRKFTGAGLTLCALLGGVIQGHSQITVKVDSTKNWLGYLNVYSTNNAYIYGQNFGAAALRAAFVPAQTNATHVVLAVNTNTYNPADPFWNLPDGTPNKHLEANFYVDVGTGFAGNDVEFVGTVESNTLPAEWTCEAVIKEFASGYAFLGMTRVPLVGGSPFTVTRTIGAGNIAQYGFLTYGPNTAPGSAASLEAASIVVDNADPSITGEPVGQRSLLGGTASFTVVAAGGSPLSYQWKRYTTNLLNGGNISGATSPTLTISNVQAADATTYTVTVTDTAGSVTTSPARLRVLTPAEFANCLDNPGFELDVVVPTQVPEPWINFSGSALVNTNDGYAGDPVNYPIQTIDGTNAVRVFNAGEYNGFYQDVPASPGQIFAGDGWFYISSQELLQGTCEAFLEVQFRQGNANPIAIYNSDFVNPSSPTDTWLFLRATNGVAAGYAQTTTTNALYSVAPAGTDHVRYQLTLHNIAGGTGNVYFDAARLMKKIPVQLSVSVSGGNITLSWLSQGATSYQVVYKDNLSDASWTPLGGLVAGDGTVKSVSYPTPGSKRFYSVLTQ